MVIWGPARAAQPEQRGARRRAWPPAAERAGGDVRSDRCRSRARRPRRRRLRRLGGARHGGARVARDRRPGGDVIGDRELPRLPGGDLRRGAGGARDIQAEKFGARQITIPGEAVGVEALDGAFRLRLRDAESVIGRAVVVATGVRYRRLPVPDLAKFEGTSVHYAATQVEAQLCRGDPSSPSAAATRRDRPR